MAKRRKNTRKPKMRKNSSDTQRYHELMDEIESLERQKAIIQLESASSKKERQQKAAAVAMIDSDIKEMEDLARRYGRSQRQLMKRESGRYGDDPFARALRGEFDYRPNPMGKHTYSIVGALALAGLTYWLGTKSK
jgi:hypothetical protein